MKHLFLIFSILVATLAQAQTKVAAALNVLKKDAHLKKSKWAFYALNVDTGKEFAQYNGTAQLAPASSLKVLTTGAMLGLMGDDYKFKTELQITGTVVKGVLKGDVIIKGYGDPTFGSPFMPGSADMKEVFQYFGRALQQKGIKSIEGDIIGDASYFADAALPPSWEKKDVGNYYAASACGLNVHDNLFYVQFQQTNKIGTLPKVLRLEPEVPNFTVTSEVKTASAGSGDNAYIYSEPFAKDGNITGTIPAGSGEFYIKGALPDPAYFAAYHFLKDLDTYGISCSGKAQSLYNVSQAVGRSVIYTHYSLPLIEIIERTNLESVNLYCEVFLKMMGKVKFGTASRLEGARALIEFWRGRGLNLDGMDIYDGSGLSRSDKVTAKMMAECVRKTAIDPKTFPGFGETLPLAGVSGSLRKMCTGTKACNNLRAKSGSMQGVRSYTGFVKTNSGATLAFCMIANDFPCSDSYVRGKFEQLMVAMAEE